MWPSSGVSSGHQSTAGDERAEQLQVVERRVVQRGLEERDDVPRHDDAVEEQHRDDREHQPARRLRSSSVGSANAILGQTRNQQRRDDRDQQEELNGVGCEEILAGERIQWRSTNEGQRETPPTNLIHDGAERFGLVACERSYDR